MGGGAPQNTAQAGEFSWNGASNNGFTPEGLNQTIGGDIAAAYNSGPADSFDQSLYTGMGETTNTALDGLLSAANNNSAGLTAANNFNTSVINNNDPSLTEQTMMDTALGNNVGAGNPYLNNIIDQTTNDTYANVMASFGGSGGVGSGLQTRALAEGLGNVTNQLRYGDYERSLGRQSSALSAIEGQRQQQLGNRMAASGNAAGMFQNTLLPARIGLQVGQARDQDAAARRAGEFDLFQRTNDPAFRHLAQYTGLLQGQSANPQPEQQPGLSDWLGLGLGAASTFL